MPHHLPMVKSLLLLLLVLVLLREGVDPPGTCC
jgi:hypothetical protein